MDIELSAHGEVVGFESTSSASTIAILDRRILIALQIDSSHTNADLAQVAHVSMRTFLRGVKQATEPDDCRL
jgi:uncharacterized protein YfaQ (DUF2300 family)